MTLAAPANDNSQNSDTFPEQKTSISTSGNGKGSENCAFADGRLEEAEEPQKLESFP